MHVCMHASDEPRSNIDKAWGQSGNGVTPVLHNRATVDLALGPVPESRRCDLRKSAGDAHIDKDGQGFGSAGLA